MEAFDYAYDEYQKSLEKRCKLCDRIVLFTDADFCSEDHEEFYNEEFYNEENLENGK